MSLLWTSEAMIAAMDGRPVGVMPEGITGISIDSRSLVPGEAFFAIKGDTMDGHDFATAAMAAGAVLLVVAEAKLPALGRLNVPDDRRQRCAGGARKTWHRGACPRQGKDYRHHRLGRKDQHQGSACAMLWVRPARFTRPTNRSTITGAYH
jgi:UDP-N-acetylmuramyl pentapeptide synthase